MAVELDICDSKSSQKWGGEVRAGLTRQVVRDDSTGGGEAPKKRSQLLT
jgi:hypothetical protein